SKPERYTEPNTEYKQYLRQYIDGARSKGAIPVLITPVARLNYTNGVFKNDFPAYCTAMKEVAVEKNVGCIDLMTKSINYYTSIGYNQVYPFYMVSSNGTDYTHFTDKGATQIARLVSEGVKGLNLAISKYVLSSSTTTPTNTINPTNTPTKAPVATPTNKPVETSTLILLPEDINGDNVVNMADVIMIARSFNSQVSETNKKCDLNMDGVINMSDVIKIAVKFNAVASTLPVSTIYQAEQANFSLGVVESINTGYTGSGYINYDNVTGSYIEWTVYAPAAGTYLLNFIYANGTTVNRPLEVKVNDGVVTGSLDFDSTGVWTTWKTTGINANLNAGNNLIRATAITANGGPNIDYLEVIK
ncbi:MAG: carbohydrate-binding protein, partial [Bacillota bacterium]|nr:carbohydrate-binding protein [Bacillota bacterium]